MQIVRELEENVWREFVYDHPRGNIFHTPEMYKIFNQTKGYQPTLWAVTDDNGCPQVLLLPVQITLRGGMFHRFTTRAVAYGSILCASGLEEQRLLDMLLQAYNRDAKGKCLFTELRNLSDLSELQSVLNENSFHYEDHLNFLIDLNPSSEQIWKNIRSNAKRNIRKARKLQVTIEDISNIEDVTIAYTLLEKTYNRIKVPLADLSFFQSAFNILYPKSMMKVWVAKVENIEIGVLMLLIHRDTVYYWYTGTLSEYFSYRPGDLLVWHALEWAKQNKFRKFDFGGGGKPGEEYGVRDFKAKFGGELVNYGRNIHVHAPLSLKVSQSVYEVTRKFV